MTPTQWITLLAAMTIVESGGNPAAVNARENAHGAMQIRAAYLADVNAFAGTQLTLADVHHPTVARWCVIQYARRYQSTTPEQIARRHNGGPDGDRQACTLGYWRRVQAAMQRTTNDRNR